MNNEELDKPHDDDVSLKRMVGLQLQKLEESDDLKVYFEHNNEAS